MIYFNVAGLAPFNQAIQQEITSTLEDFGRLLYSDKGIHFYRETLQRCRQHLAQFLQVEDAQRIAFVPNATTASALVLSRIHWESGDSVLTTTHENSTVLKEISTLQSKGVQIETLEPSSPAELESAIEQRLRTTQIRAILISHVSHIDGRIFPIERLSQLTQKYRTLLIIDGAQAAGHIPVSFQDWQPDAYFFPGHKWCAGPMGTGALILGAQFTEHDERKNSKHPSWSHFELGTQNIGLLSGFAKACLIKQEDGMMIARLEHIRKEVRQELSKIPQLRMLEWDGPQSPGILSFTSPQKETNGQLASPSQDIAWKTFPLPNTPDQTGNRLSWSSDTSDPEIASLLVFFRNQH